MCTHDDGFQNTELEASTSQKVRKAIRFQPCSNFLVDWPSRHSRVPPDVTANHIVIPSNQVITLQFEGQNCRPWSKGACQEFAQIISNELNWTATRRYV